MWWVRMARKGVVGGRGVKRKVKQGGQELLHGAVAGTK